MLNISFTHKPYAPIFMRLILFIELSIAAAFTQANVRETAPGKETVNLLRRVQYHHIQKQRTKAKNRHITFQGFKKLRQLVKQQFAQNI